LSARLIDRPIRPLFADGFRNEVQIVNTVMSCDPDNSPEMTAMLGASLALCISDIPFDGPVAGVIVGRVDGKFVIDPTVEQKAKSDINLTVAGTSSAIMMVEAGADQVPEEEMLDAIMFGTKPSKNSALSKKRSSKRLAKPSATSIFIPPIPPSKRTSKAGSKSGWSKPSRSSTSFSAKMPSML
jgi:polyribonucleotide nucleotidyltransferase